jgi:Concanavalin A-like lectin/glucanases superfamily
MSTTSSPVGGKIGQALRFDGISSYVDAGNAVNLQLSTGTLTAWVKTTNPTAVYQSIVVKQNAYSMFMQNTHLVFYDWNVSATRNCGFTLNDGKWHFVAISFQSGTTNGTKCYADGNYVYADTMTVAAQTDSVLIGYGNCCNENFDGIIDDARIYGRNLSATEVKQLYNAGR